MVWRISLAEPSKVRPEIAAAKRVVIKLGTRVLTHDDGRVALGQFFGIVETLARCLDAGARVLGTTGRAFSEESIGDRLGMRDLKESLRGAGVASGGPPPMSEKDRSRFLNRLDTIIQAIRRQEGA